jgi:hypothetical protein
MNRVKRIRLPRLTSVGVCFTALFLLAQLTACGGGVSLADNGGIGGSGRVSGSGGGEITGFGSVIFDDSRFEVTDSTRFSVDGVEVNSQSDLAEGMIATFEIGDDASSDLSSGTALRIDAATALKGIVTGVLTASTPLKVLDQEIVVTGDTVLANIPGNDLSNLNTSDLVEVYGIVDANNIVRATRIEYKTLDGLLEWKLTGFASNVTSASLSIGAQVVDVAGVVIDDCASTLANGDFVEIKAATNPGFVSGDTMELVSKVECELRGIPVPTNPSATVIPAQFEGVVSDYTGSGDTEFYLGAQRVVLGGALEYRGGTSEDLLNGARIEAEGQFNTGTGLLTASKIKFKQTRVRIEAPLSASEVVTGESISVLGLTVVGTAATEDDDAILSSASGLPAQVEVRGFIDGDGTIYAEEIRERGSVDNGDIRLRGPIDSLANPSLEILGIPVDLTGALAYLDANDSAVADIDAFFALLSAGDIVQVEDAQLNAGPAIVMDVDSVVGLED